MVSLDTFLSRLLPRAPACPEPYAIQALIDTCIEFADKSLVLRENLDQITLVPNLTQYELDLPTTSHQIARILNVTTEGRDLIPVLQEDIPRLNHGQVGKPSHYFTSRAENEFLLNIWPSPDERTRCIVHAAIKPTRDATQVDDELYNSWADTIICGALAKIYSTPNENFMDYNYSRTLRDKFLREVSMARNESYYGKVRGNQSVKMRTFV